MVVRLGRESRRESLQSKLDSIDASLGRDLRPNRTECHKNGTFQRRVIVNANATSG
jgi:hypothetical protein